MNTQRKIDICFKVQHGKCIYCQVPMWRKPPEISIKRPRGTFKQTLSGHLGKMATLEHIIPTGKGGSRSNSTNHVTSCFKCNQTRKAINHKLFLFITKMGLMDVLEWSYENWFVQFFYYGRITHKNRVRFARRFPYSYSIYYKFYYTNIRKKINRFKRKCGFQHGLTKKGRRIIKQRYHTKRNQVRKAAICWQLPVVVHCTLGYSPVLF